MKKFAQPTRRKRYGAGRHGLRFTHPSTPPMPARGGKTRGGWSRPEDGSGGPPVGQFPKR